MTMLQMRARSAFEGADRAVCPRSGRDLRCVSLQTKPPAMRACSFLTELDDPVPIVGRRLQNEADDAGQIDSGDDVLGMICGELLQRIQRAKPVLAGIHLINAAPVI